MNKIKEIMVVIIAVTAIPTAFMVILIHDLFKQIIAKMAILISPHKK